MQNKTALQFKMFQYTINILGLPNVKNKKKSYFFLKLFQRDSFSSGNTKVSILKVGSFSGYKNTHSSYMLIVNFYTSFILKGHKCPSRRTFSFIYKYTNAEAI